MPLHFAVKFLNLEMASFITLLGLSSPEKNHEESVGTRDSLARKYEKRVRNSVILCYMLRISLSPKAMG